MSETTTLGYFTSSPEKAWNQGESMRKNLGLSEEMPDEIVIGTFKAVSLCIEPIGGGSRRGSEIIFAGYTDTDDFASVARSNLKLGQDKLTTPNTSWRVDLVIKGAQDATITG